MARIKKEAKVEVNLLKEALAGHEQMTPGKWKQMGTRISNALRDILAAAERRPAKREEEEDSMLSWDETEHSDEEDAE